MSLFSPHIALRSGASLSLALLALACVLAAGTAAAEQAAIVTATAGVSEGGMQKGSAVAHGQPISTGAAENMALVLEDDALLQLCARSLVTLRRHAVRRAQIIELEGGEARFVVSPRSPDERIEVHTPSAIATILGTVVLVKVDPVTGETTVSSEENQVEVRSNDPNVPGSTRVSPGQQCVVEAGQAPSEARELPEAVFATLGECLMDLENAALAEDRIARRKRDLEKIAMADSDLLDLPSIASAGGAIPEFGLADPNALAGPGDPNDPVDPSTVPLASLQGFQPPPVVPPPIDPPPPPCTVGACLPGFP